MKKRLCFLVLFLSNIVFVSPTRASESADIPVRLSVIKSLTAFADGIDFDQLNHTKTDLLPRQNQVNKVVTAVSSADLPLSESDFSNSHLRFGYACVEGATTVSFSHHKLSVTNNREIHFSAVPRLANRNCYDLEARLTSSESESPAFLPQSITTTFAIE